MIKIRQQQRYCCIPKNTSLQQFNDIEFTHRYKRKIFDNIEKAKECVKFHKKLNENYKIIKLTITMEAIDDNQ